MINSRFMGVTLIVIMNCFYHERAAHLLYLTHLVHPVQLELGEDGELLSLAGHLLHHGDECWQII